MSVRNVDMVSTTTKKPTVISTFAGCGGSSLGYKMAGFEELLAIDFDPNAVETFRLNFPGVEMWHRDIRDVTAEEIFETTGLKKGELDVFDGSPPCQGFSTTGKRKVADDRNDLFKDFVRLVDELAPKVFVMENVTGMIKGKMKGRFNEILKELKALDYDVKVKQMNAKYYNVPQSRERLIFIGVRKDLKTEVTFPKANLNIITAGKAVEGVVAKTFTKLEKDWLTFDLWTRMKAGKNATEVHPKGSAFNLVKISPEKPCPTIPKTVSIGNKRYGAHLHWKEPRTLSIEELKRLSSFPDDFQFIGKFEDQWARIGNAVMPNMMKAIALHIKKNILKT